MLPMVQPVSSTSWDKPVDYGVWIYVDVLVVNSKYSSVPHNQCSNEYSIVVMSMCFRGVGAKYFVRRVFNLDNIIIEILI